MLRILPFISIVVREILQFRERRVCEQISVRQCEHWRDKEPGGDEPSAYRFVASVTLVVVVLVAKQMSTVARYQSISVGCRVPHCRQTHTHPSHWPAGCEAVTSPAGYSNHSHSALRCRRTMATVQPKRHACVWRQTCNIAPATFLRATAYML